MSSKDTPNSEQNIVRKKLTEAFLASAKHLNIDIDKDFLETTVRRLEREAYNCTIRECERLYTDRSWGDPKFVSIYSSICYKLLANLDPESSVGTTGLAKRILYKEIDPREVCKFTSQEMNPEASLLERNTIETRLQQAVVRKYTDKYVCKKCDAKKATYREFQGAGGDEISTIKFECLECGHTW